MKGLTLGAILLVALLSPSFALADVTAGVEVPISKKPAEFMIKAQAQLDLFNAIVEAAEVDGLLVEMTGYGQISKRRMLSFGGKAQVPSLVTTSMASAEIAGQSGSSRGQEVSYSYRIISAALVPCHPPPPHCDPEGDG